MSFSIKKSKRLAVVSSVLVVASAVIALEVADSQTPPEAGPAVNTHVGHSNIYVVEVASGDLTQPTNQMGEGAREPTWESDGEIAFSTMDCDECPSEIGQVGGGAGQTTVEAPVKHVFQPSAAPDGDRLAVVGLGRGIYSVDATTGTTKRLTEGVSDEAPAWSGTGEWIAFQRQIRDTNYDLFAVHAGTGKERRLTNDARQQTNPSWSADGTRIAFSEQQTNGKWAIYTMNADGSGRKRVTPADTSAQEPAWSPDGTKIAFILQGLDKASVAIISASGSGTPKPLTGDSLYQARPTWSPDGSNIAFSAMAVPQ